MFVSSFKTLETFLKTSIFEKSESLCQVLSSFWNVSVTFPTKEHNTHIFERHS